MSSNPSDDSGLVGASVDRTEDRRLLTGRARYTGDVEGGLHLAIHRSRYGHATVEGVDVSGATDAEGVLAAYTHEDLDVDNRVPGDDPGFGTAVERPILAGDRVCYQGQPVAAVLATDRYRAHDAADRVDVEYDRLPAVTDPASAVDGGPSVHESVPDNVAFEFEVGDRADTERAFETAAREVSVDVPINRVAAVPMETRSVRARRDGDALVVEMSTQNPHSVRDDLTDVLGLPEEDVVVRVPDVGGAFGVKLQAYPAHLLAAWCALRRDRPVRWSATRTEAFASTNHARRHELTARAALDDGGRIDALQVDTVADVGAYLSQGGSLVPTYAFGTRLTGQYAIDHAHVSVTGAYTNTVPLAAYRGAGRPEAAYVIERLARACARELDEDPVAFRRRNLLDPDGFPYETPLGSTYDSGDYEKTLDRALEMFDYDDFRRRQREAREDGRYLGVGVSAYIEVCGGSSRSTETGLVELTADGGVEARTGTVELGQGHRTSYAQVVADELGVDHDDVEVTEGDTDEVPAGGGTAGSRSMPMGGNALKESAREVRRRARALAADHLEADPQDLVFEDGRFHVAGAPDRGITLREVAEAEGGVENDTRYSPEGSTAPFGTHLAAVELDPRTGEIELLEYVAVDDVGTQINPGLVRDQVVGGIVQSIGQAFHEEVAYDDNGTLVNGSLQDYALPRAGDVPEVRWDSTVTPSPNNELGVKGVGEAGTIGALPAVVNAVADALEPFDADLPALPLTAESVWSVLHDDR